MSLSTYQFPCVTSGYSVAAKNRTTIAICSSHKEAEEICTILNAHFAKKEERNLKGICSKCAKPHCGSMIGGTCLKTGCGGAVVESIPFTVDAQPPTPNQAETDAVAVKYYESGRTLIIEGWSSQHSQWIIECNPTFEYSRAWRIRPTKRKEIVEVYKGADTGSRIYIGTDNRSDLRPFKAESAWKFCGTIEGEVEL